MHGALTLPLAATACGDPKAPSGGSWASGGTAALRRASIDEPFVAASSNNELTCSATIGPCYAKTLERRDISEGQPGLPTRLAFRIVGVSGAPIANAAVDVWHAAPKGVYSGNDAEQMCTGNDAEALQARWFRGVQTGNAAGRVDFDTCFPGWYPGRTVHVHFTVRVNGVELVTSQLGFDDRVVDEIMAGVAIYKDRGKRDTTNAMDSIIGAANVFDTKQLPNGILLASKTLVLRATTEEALCAIEGRGGRPGRPPPGGPPPGGGRPPPKLRF